MKALLGRAALLLVRPAVLGCGRNESSSSTDEHGHTGEHAHAEEVSGSQVGRLLSAEDVQLELQLSEDEDPPPTRPSSMTAGKLQRPPASGS